MGEEKALSLLPVPVNVGNNVHIYMQWIYYYLDVAPDLHVL